MSIAILSDNHLCESKLRGLLKGDSYFALNAEVNYIVSHEIKNVIFAGDTFDTNRPDGLTLNVFSDAVSKLRDNGVNLFAIQGNHDKSKEPIFSAFGVKHIDSEKVEIDGKSFYGLDYYTGTDLINKLSDVPEVEYLVIHTAFKHLFGMEGACTLTPDLVPEYIKNVIVGHVHIKDDRFLGKCRIISPSSPYPTNCGEFNKPHGFYVLEPNNSLRYVELVCRHNETISYDASTRDSAQQLLLNFAKKHVDDELKPLLYLVRTGAEALVVPDEVVGVDMPKAIVPYIDVQDSDKISINMVDNIDLVLDPEKEKEANFLLRSLFESQSYEDTLAEYLKTNDIKVA